MCRLCVWIATSMLLGLVTVTLGCTKVKPNDVVFEGGVCGSQDMKTVTARFKVDKSAGTVLMQISTSERPAEVRTEAYKDCVIHDEANWQCKITTAGGSTTISRAGESAWLRQFFYSTTYTPSSTSEACFKAQE